MKKLFLTVCACAMAGLAFAEPTIAIDPRSNVERKVTSNIYGQFESPAFSNSAMVYITATASGVWSSALDLSLTAAVTSNKQPIFVALIAPDTNTASVQVSVSVSAPLSTDYGFPLQAGDARDRGWYQAQAGWQVRAKTASASAQGLWLSLRW